jgi:hypothetical protein
MGYKRVKYRLNFENGDWRVIFRLKKQDDTSGLPYEICYYYGEKKISNRLPVNISELTPLLKTEVIPLKLENDKYADKKVRLEQASEIFDYHKNEIEMFFIQKVIDRNLEGIFRFFMGFRYKRESLETMKNKKMTLTTDVSGEDLFKIDRDNIHFERIGSMRLGNFATLKKNSSVPPRDFPTHNIKTRSSSVSPFLRFLQVKEVKDVMSKNKDLEILENFLSEINSNLIEISIDKYREYFDVMLKHFLKEEHVDDLSDKFSSLSGEDFISLVFTKLMNYKKNEKEIIDLLGEEFCKKLEKIMSKTSAAIRKVNYYFTYNPEHGRIYKKHLPVSALDEWRSGDFELGEGLLNCLFSSPRDIVGRGPVKTLFKEYASTIKPGYFKKVSRQEKVTSVGFDFTMTVPVDFFGGSEVYVDGSLLGRYAQSGIVSGEIDNDL